MSGARTNCSPVNSPWARRVLSRRVRWAARRQPKLTLQMHAEILSWSRSQGLFAGLALEGATLRQDLSDNATLYGKKLENREIVTSGMRAPKAASKLWACSTSTRRTSAKPFHRWSDKPCIQIHERNNVKTIGAFLLACGILSAQAPQAPNPTQQSNTGTPGGRPAPRRSIGLPWSARTMKAINYNHRSGSTGSVFVEPP